MATLVDVAIIGAGPLGIELAIALKEQGINYLQFEKNQIGQMIYDFPVSTRFFSSSERIALAGAAIQTVDQQKCTREEYLAYLRALVLQFGLTVNTYEEVVSIEPVGARFKLITYSSKGEQHYQVAYLVLATGGTAEPNRLHVPGEDLPHVSTKMLDPHLYFQKKVSIIGGKNSAAESALRCYHAGAKVTMVVRRPEFNPDDVKYWILPELLGLIRNGEISCMYQSHVVQIYADSIRVSHDSKEISSTIATDFVIKAIGFEADMRLFQQLGVTLSDTKIPSFDPTTMETDVNHVWVIGTATAGTQKKYRVFIENCHPQVLKIVASLCQKMNREFRPSTLAFANETPLKGAEQ